MTAISDGKPWMLAILAGGGLFLSLTITLAHGPGHNPSRHQYIMRNGVPVVYNGRVNPLQLTTENLSAGKGLYAENCGTCHGARGRSETGDAEDLTPRLPFSQACTIAK